MQFEEFFKLARAKNLQFGSEKERVGFHKPALLSNEALFQLPFLAMVILTLSKGRRKPDRSKVGQLVGECLERTLVGFKGSSQFIGWSANLRIRTVRALTFLEASALVTVDAKSMAIAVTDKGKKLLDLAMNGDGNLAETLRHVDRSYRNVSVENQIESVLI